MSNGTGQGPKKETVYSGPTPPAPGSKGTVYGGASPTQGTVYNGPTQGTVYGGSEPSSVFDESKFVGKKADASVAIQATQRKVRGVAIGLFIVAAISLIEALIFWSDNPIEGASAAIVCGIFVLLGFFIFRMSRVAFLIAMALYVLDTLELLYDAFNSPAMVTSLALLALHGFILYRLWLIYGQLEELHTL